MYYLLCYLGVAADNRIAPPPNHRRIHSFMTTEDVAAGKKTKWSELEITGTVFQHKIN